MQEQEAAASPRRRSAEASRARILDSAAGAFARGGYNGASLDRIAQHAGLTTAGVLHHFASKQEVLAALLGSRDDEGDRVGAGRSEPLAGIAGLPDIARRCRPPGPDTRVRCAAR